MKLFLFESEKIPGLNFAMLADGRVLRTFSDNLLGQIAADYTFLYDVVVVEEGQSPPGYRDALCLNTLRTQAQETELLPPLKMAVAVMKGKVPKEHVAMMLVRLGTKAAGESNE